MPCSLALTPQLDLQGVMPLADRIMSQYSAQVSDPSTLKTIMATNQAYSMAKTPVLKVTGGVVPNPAHRVVQDDIPHGLCVLKDIAEQLHQRTPWIDLLLEWHQDLMGKQYIVGGKLSGRDIGETSALTVLGNNVIVTADQQAAPVYRALATSRPLSSRASCSGMAHCSCVWCVYFGSANWFTLNFGLA